ncbi:MAG TPA: CAP domain-containing protein [Gaiellaceae bacterium]|nr:CAP domain-containing protein [Gaiellaceae bacterium]
MAAKKLLALAVLALALAAPSSGSARGQGSVSTAAALQSALVAKVNALRAAHGLATLRVVTSLRSAATFHSTEMAKVGYFSHNSANGTSFAKRIASFYTLSGYQRWAVGENLLWASPDVGAVQAMKLWMNSAPHRQNLLDPRWRDMGLSAVHSTSAPGVYGNAAATIVTADFGVRAK